MSPPVIAFGGALLVDPEGDPEGEPEPRDLWAAAGVIQEGRPPASAEVIDCAGLCLAPGIVDLGVKVSEPGERHRESFRSASEAALAGGVTTIVTRPDTAPAIDTPEALAYVARRAAEAARVHVRPMAALTIGREGRQMTEMAFLRDAGAVAVTDCDAVTRDVRVASRCWRYAASLGLPVISHVQEPTLSEGAHATSNAFATLRGLAGVSALAERMGLERDLTLARMTGARWHADQVTTAAALEPLSRAKAEGLDVTAGTSIHHATLNALDVADWRTFFKVKPPLRDEDDRRAVVEAIRDGTIDTLSSYHTPQDEESKRLPFEAAASGAVGLETLLPAALRLHHSDGVPLPRLWRALSWGPARRLGLPGGSLTPGAPADLVLFDPHAPFVLDRFALRSKSKNTPFDGARLQGRVRGVWLGGERAL